MLALVASLVAAPLLAAAPPQFVLPPNLPPATIGTKYTYYFCKPIAATTNGVCGSLRRASTNPVGGGGPPYLFSQQRGTFLPPRLTISNRTGILTGTVAAGLARARVYRFGVCVSSARADGTICRTTRLPVLAAPEAEGAFAGAWSGDYTLTTYAGPGRCNPITITGRATATIAKDGDAYTAAFTLVGGSFSNSGLDANGNCAIHSRWDSNWEARMTRATAKTITGDNWALTLSDENTIIGTNTAYSRIELTLKRG